MLYEVITRADRPPVRARSGPAPRRARDDARPTAEALAIADGKILALGTTAEIEQAYKGAATRVVDLGGKALLPAFIDLV